MGNNKFGEAIGTLIYGFLVMALIAVFMGYPVMWLWNYTMPYLFEFRELDFFHALALNLLCGILFNKGDRSRKSKKQPKNDLN